MKISIGNHRKNIFLFFLICLFTLGAFDCIYSQDCWKEISITPINETCGGSNDGSIKIVAIPTHGPDILRRVFIEVYSYFPTFHLVRKGDILDGLIGELSPGTYKVRVELRDGGLNLICFSEAYPFIGSSGCDISVGNLDFDTNAASPGFLTFQTKVSGHFCSFGEPSAGLIINKKDTIDPGLDDWIKGGVYSNEVKKRTMYPLLIYPGDAIQLFVDNGNSIASDIPSTECRKYTNTVELPCDLSIDSFQISRQACGDFEINGKLNTQYLKLKTNPDAYYYNNWLFNYYGSDFFDISLTTSTSELIYKHRVVEESGRFTYIIPSSSLEGVDFNMEWKLGNCPTLTIPITKPLIREPMIWTGKGGDNNWENGNNWNCGIPGTLNDVIIPFGEVVIHSEVSVKSLRVDNDAKLTVTSGYHLTILNSR